jgi:hypothetical protein
MNRNDKHHGILSTGSSAVSPRTVLGTLALAGALLLSACATGTDPAEEGPYSPIVTETSTPADTGSPNDFPASTEPATPSEPTAPETPADDDDAGWFAEADSACSLAIEEYQSQKAQAGAGAAPEALALAAASAATRAADAIESLPEPASAEAQTLREGVVAWATAYRDMALAMESGTYSEVVAAGDDIEVAADEIRGGSGSSAPSCLQLLQDV